MDDIWIKLTARALEVAQHAYAPYSELKVGAAGANSNGDIFVGCNIENSSFGLTLCAECSMISQMALSGSMDLAFVVCLDESGKLLAPCGRCRQLLAEFGGEHCQVLTNDGPATLSYLLPGAFSSADLK
jgi:cytidine deaminase